MATQPDGQIVLSGNADNGATGVDYALVRYNADGSLDLPFGGGTARPRRLPQRRQRHGETVLLQPDGKIVMGGREHTDIPVGGAPRSTIARFNANGTLASFWRRRPSTIAERLPPRLPALRHCPWIRRRDRCGGRLSTLPVIGLCHHPPESHGTPALTFEQRWKKFVALRIPVGGGRSDVSVQGNGKILVTGEADRGRRRQRFRSRAREPGWRALIPASVAVTGRCMTPSAPWTTSLLAYRAARRSDHGRRPGGGHGRRSPDHPLGQRRPLPGHPVRRDDDARRAPTFTEGCPAVVLDADDDVRDADLDALDSGSGNYDGADLVLERNRRRERRGPLLLRSRQRHHRDGGLLKSLQVIATFDLPPRPASSISFTDANGRSPRRQTSTTSSPDRLRQQLGLSAAIPMQNQFRHSPTTPRPRNETPGNHRVDHGLLRLHQAHHHRPRTDLGRLLRGDTHQLPDAVQLHRPRPETHLFRWRRHRPRATTSSSVDKTHDLRPAAPPCTLDHEIERYNLTTGEFIAWVRIPSLNTMMWVTRPTRSSTSPTLTVPSPLPPEIRPGVDAGYQGVWHLEEGDVTDEATDGSHDDSTGVNDGSQNGNVEGVGMVAFGQDFDGTSSSVRRPDPTGPRQVGCRSRPLRRVSGCGRMRRLGHAADWQAGGGRRLVIRVGPFSSVRHWRPRLTDWASDL